MSRTFTIKEQIDEEIIPLYGRFLHCMRTEFATTDFMIVVASQGKELRGTSGEYYVDVRNGSYYWMTVHIAPFLHSVETGIVKLDGYKLCINHCDESADTLAHNTHRAAVTDITRRFKDGDFDGTYSDNVKRHKRKEGQLTFL
jgi:hypothetical protein